MTDQPKTIAGFSPSLLRTFASLMLMIGSAMVHVGLSLVGEVGHDVHGRIIEASEVYGKVIPGLVLMLAAIWPIVALLKLVDPSDKKRIIAGFLAWALMLLGTGTFLGSSKPIAPSVQTFYWICFGAGVVAGLVWTFSKSSSKPEHGDSAED